MLEHDSETGGWLTCDHVEWVEESGGYLSCADCGMDVSYWDYLFEQEEQL
jgi:hypothetical protein